MHKNYWDDKRNVLVTDCPHHGRREWTPVDLVAMKLFGYDGRIEQAPRHVQAGVRAWFTANYPDQFRE